MIAGIPGHDPDRSAAGIPPEERPLGASEHFDSVDVQEIDHRTHGACVVDVVDVEADTGFKIGCEIRLPDSTNERCEHRGCP